MTILSVAFLLLIVMDPMGNVPFFIAALKHVEPARHRRVVTRELLIALAVMVLFLFVGRFALQVLHISEPALTLAGGVILFLIAIRMVFPSSERSMHEEIRGEPFVVPLAIPYVAAPSLLAAESLLMSQDVGRWFEWLTALVLAWLVSSIVLYSSSSLRRVLGERGLIAVERLMGVILVAVSIQMLLSGWKIAVKDQPA
jgi:multiple antibiotic resistance protein